MLAHISRYHPLFDILQLERLPLQQNRPDLSSGSWLVEVNMNADAVNIELPRYLRLVWLESRAD
jgi:hypothetical protein